MTGAGGIDALFALPEAGDSLAPTGREKPEKLSPDRARTERQRRAIAEGRHPLENVWPTWRHPETKGLAYERTDPKGRPYTCGSCRFRRVLGAGARSVPKCTEGEQWPRATHSAASDVRAFWPACDRYQAGDGTLSPDAARCLPGGAP